MDKKSSHYFEKHHLKTSVRVVESSQVRFCSCGKNILFCSVLRFVHQHSRVIINVINHTSGSTYCTSVRIGICPRDTLVCRHTCARAHHSLRCCCSHALSHTTLLHGLDFRCRCTCDWQRFRPMGAVARPCCHQRRHETCTRRTFWHDATHMRQNLYFREY